MVPLSVCIAWSAGSSQADAPTFPGRAGRSQDPQLHAITGTDAPRLAPSGTRAQGLDDPGLDGRLKEPQLLGQLDDEARRVMRPASKDSMVQCSAI